MKKMFVIAVLVSRLVYSEDYETIDTIAVEYEPLTDTFYYEGTTIEVGEDEPVYREGETLEVDKEEILK